jgi:long-chain acyl-CoA synthetase
MLNNAVALAEREVSRADILADAKRVMRGLDALGIVESDSVALLMRNDLAVLEVYSAAADLGVYAIPLNWHLKRDEIRYLIADSRPKALIAHSDLLAGICDALPEDIHLLVVPTPMEAQLHYAVSDRLSEIPARSMIWSAWKAQLPSWEGPAKAARGSIFYTSGTTGNPKGVKREPMNAEQSAAFTALQRQLFGACENMRAYCACPLCHGTGTSFARLALREADCLLLQPHFDPVELLASIDRERITHVAVVPTAFVRLLKLPDAVRRRYDVSSLRYVLHTGAPCPPDIKHEMIRWLGPIINEVYGSTEVGPLTLCSSSDWLTRPGTVGRAMTGATIRILDALGRECKPGEQGEICGQHGAIPQFTYLNLPEARRALDRGGLVATGDIGYLDEDGYLFLSDRRDDMVISGGVNLYPAEIERVLITMPEILDCAVFGIPDREYGESLAAAIVLTSGSTLTEDTIRRYLKMRLANYKVPRVLLFDNRLPREESGKISKRKLRTRYLEGTGGPSAGAI